MAEIRSAVRGFKMSFILIFDSSRCQPEIPCMIEPDNMSGLRMFLGFRERETRKRGKTVW